MPALDGRAVACCRCATALRQRGYDPLEPVVVYEGRVLDGWRRYSIARELGVEVTTVDYRGDDPAGLVIARHTGVAT